MNKIKQTLKQMLTSKRYKHVLGVEETAIELACKYGADMEKVRKAALLHDCSKQFTITKMKELCDCEETLKHYGDMGELIHGFSGSVYAKQKFGIEDEEILNAIKYHTIGRRNMSLVEKITYLADAIEPSRDYADVEHIRHLAFENIDWAILHEADRKIEYLIKREAVIHPSTMDMRNWLLTKIKKERADNG